MTTQTAPQVLASMFGEMERGRPARDQALWKEVCLVVDKETLRTLHDAQKTYRQAQRALSEATAALAAIDATAPENAGDVQKWATRKSDAANLVAAQARFVEAAEHAYLALATKARALIMTEAERRVTYIARSREKVDQQYRDMKDQARLFIATANEERDAVSRLWQKVNGPADRLFEEV